MNGFFVILKIVGMEFMVKMMLLIFIIVSMSNSGVVIFILFCMVKKLSSS